MQTNIQADTQTYVQAAVQTDVQAAVQTDLQVGISTGQSSSSLNFPYNGWSYTSSSIPDNYALISIESIAINSENSYYTFNITNKVIGQTLINITI